METGQMPCRFSSPLSIWKRDGLSAGAGVKSKMLFRRVPISRQRPHMYVLSAALKRRLRRLVTSIVAALPDPAKHLSNPRRALQSCRNFVSIRYFDTRSSSSIPDHQQLRPASELKSRSYPSRIDSYISLAQSLPSPITKRRTR